MVNVPREAVIRGGSMNRVVVALGKGRFEARPVRIGIESGDRVAIRSGLDEGETVVVSGQFLIDSESNIESALSRMNEEEAGGEMDHSQPEMDHSQHRMEDGS